MYRNPRDPPPTTSKYAPGTERLHSISEASDRRVSSLMDTTYWLSEQTGLLDMAMALVLSQKMDQGFGVPFEYSRILFTVVRCDSFGLDCYLAHKTVENWISSFVRVKYISDPIIPLYEVSLIGLPTRSGPKLFGGTMGVFTKELSEISYFLILGVTREGFFVLRLFQDM
ncbi:hypothetical protein Tco_0479224 [Tanacetum coccineum]